MQIICIYNIAEIVYTVNMTVEKALKDKKLKITKQRIAVAKILEHAHTPLKIETIFSSLPSPRPDLVTIYRILETFEKSSLVHKVDLRHGHAHYEWSDEHHHHMVCTNCHTTYPLHSPALEKILATIASKHKKEIRITDHALELFGLCTKCS